VQAKQEAFLSAFGEMQWGYGWDMASDRGAKHIIEEAGLDWKEAKAVLDQNSHNGDEPWRKLEAANQAELCSNDIWGVPSFRYGDQAWWGQDRLRCVEDTIVNDMMSQ
jgi:2-hydroxychromene-2-carboxylate isomerase